MGEQDVELSGIASLRSPVRVNIVANYIGRGWATIIGILCLPLFLKLLGREAYGLIGAFAVVQAWAMLLDFGLTPTLNREVVRTRAGMRSWQSLADLLCSIELVVVLLAGAIALTIGLAAPMLTANWLQPDELAPRTVMLAIALMGVLAATRWIEQVYRGAIQGSEDQVWLNFVQVGTETARWLGALLVIAMIDADVLLFFGWNLIVSFASALMLRQRMRTFLRGYVEALGRIRLNELHTVRGFAGGMFLSSILAFLLTQADKLIVGGTVSLADFGIYALAGTAASGLLQLVQPMNVAILPRFTTLVEERRTADLARMFHTVAQWLSLIVLPIGLLVIVMPEAALLAWTGQPSVTLAGAPILSLLMLASVLNALANVPYMLQLANGWTSITNKTNAVVILVLLPVMIWATRTHAGVGAAATLAGLNLLSLGIVSAIVMRKVLPGEYLSWLMRAVFLPVILGGGVAVLLRLVLPIATARWFAFAELVLAGGAISLAALLALPYPRQSLLAYLVSRR